MRLVVNSRIGSCGWIFFAALAAGCTRGASAVRDGGMGGGARDGANSQPTGVTVTSGRQAGEGPVRASDTVTVRVTGPLPGAPAVEYYDEDLEKSEKGGHPTKMMVPLTKGADGWKASIPPQPDGVVVRYRIVNAGSAVSPTGNGWYAYFVTPQLTGKSFTYFLFITQKNWSKLWTNIKDGRVKDNPPSDAGPTGYACALNPTYNDKVHAILANSNGEAADIQVRYQGSPFNRRNGPGTATGAEKDPPGSKMWPADKAPDGPIPVQGLSWNFTIGGDADPDGKKTTTLSSSMLKGNKEIILIKRANECSMFTTGVGGQLFESVGIPSSKTGVARLYVNGVYLHFYTDLEHQDGNMLQRFYGKDHKVGDLFKAIGWNGEQGPFTWADGREFEASCGYSPAERYTLNYQRTTPKNKTGADEVARLVHDLNVARAAGVPAMRAFYADNFDVDEVTTYVALINWLYPWDDFFQNYFLYRRADGKWIFTPTDFDRMFGDYSAEKDVPPAEGSFYIGEVGNRSNRIARGVQWTSYWKDTFIKAYRPELEARLKKLVENDVTPAKVYPLIDAMNASYSPEDAKMSSTGAFCEPAPFVERLKKFVTDRNERVRLGLFK